MSVVGHIVLTPDLQFAGGGGARIIQQVEHSNLSPIGGFFCFFITVSSGPSYYYKKQYFRRTTKIWNNFEFHPFWGLLYRIKTTTEFEIGN